MPPVYELTGERLAIIAEEHRDQFSRRLPTALERRESFRTRVATSPTARQDSSRSSLRGVLPQKNRATMRVCASLPYKPPRSAPLAQNRFQVMCRRASFRRACLIVQGFS